MEPFYEGDLKDIWDSDLDPAETLKISTENNIHDWYMDKDVKDSFNDKLISDALLNGIPIKSEHSYSSNKNATSLSVSSKKMLIKIDDMEEECYPAISLKTATCSFRQEDISFSDSQNIIIRKPYLNKHFQESYKKFGSLDPENPSQCIPSNYLKKIVAIPMTLNLQNISVSNKRPVLNSTRVNFDSISSSTPKQLQYIPQNTNINISSRLILREKKKIVDISSDIEIDESFIKDEPKSPHCSSPPSPNLNSIGDASTNDLNNNMSGFQQFIEKMHAPFNSTTLDIPMVESQLINGSKPCVKVDSMIFDSTFSSTKSLEKSTSYGLPLTPPSSSPSDESQGNITPDHTLSPPFCNIGSLKKKKLNELSVPNLVNLEENSCSSLLSLNNSFNVPMRNSNGIHTRQPIHTPLISSQPKGSTGALFLTEEEKRTLLAEGYPIPQKLPLTKAEEKSLKKIRRKIKNKISAQESRRKKKEYMDQLERRVELLVNENNNYRKRVESLEVSNSNLHDQLHKLQTLFNKQNVKNCKVTKKIN